MKYCPYCGEELWDEKAPFCAECGKQIPERKNQPEMKDDICRDSVIETETVSAGQHEVPQQYEATPEADDGETTVFPDCYDGYYDDIIPDDHGSIRTVVDKQLIKKIVVLGISVILIIAACIAIMYIL